MSGIYSTHGAYDTWFATHNGYAGAERRKTSCRYLKGLTVSVVDCLIVSVVIHSHVCAGRGYGITFLHGLVVPGTVSPRGYRFSWLACRNCSNGLGSHSSRRSPRSTSRRSFLPDGTILRGCRDPGCNDRAGILETNTTAYSVPLPMGGSDDGAFYSRVLTTSLRHHQWYARSQTAGEHHRNVVYND